MDAPRRPFILPRKLIEAAEQEQRSAWLSTLSDTVARLAHAWSITVGTPFEPGGQTAWVAPVRDRAGNDLVLKVAWRHDEALHKADGLRAWGGHGAVRLHASWSSTPNRTSAIRPTTRYSTCSTVRGDCIPTRGRSRHEWPTCSTLTTTD